MSDEAVWFHRDGTSWVLSIHLQPGARKTEVAGMHDGCLKLKLNAPPVEGKANAALVAWLAERFAVPKNRVAIRTGELSRRKVVVVAESSVHPSSLLPG